MDANFFDCSVYVKLHNNTKETLYNDPDRTKASHGFWRYVPSSIAPGKTAQFELKDHGGAYGSDGTFDFIVRDSQKQQRANMYTYEACPWPSGSNRVSFTPPTPQALYNVYFDASVDGGRPTRNWVQSGGHPINVEYTIEYQPTRFRFRLDTITAVCAHPVRNSRDDLVAEKHVLWDRSYPDKFKDGKQGSFAPNVFAYDFKSRVSDAGHLDVTVRPLDVELSGAEVILYGSIDGKHVLQTDYFFLKALAPVTVQAHVVSPSTKDRPFAWNADVQWSMELRLSAKPVEAYGPSTTPLELYWIATTAHPAFQNGIPVGFLRDVLKKAPKTATATEEKEEGGSTEENAVSSDYNKDMARQCFFDWNKIYDTAGGASACNMGIWGGVFNEAYYRACDEHGNPGALARRINCMDQAAMLTLQCSLYGYPSTSWLAQKPFGFIKRTNLVGVRDEIGYLTTVNNPFFGTELNLANVADNYPDRTCFGCHVYVGHSKPFNIGSDGIYDACGGPGGPHSGNETAAQYVAASIDTGTNLYQTRGIHPGTVNNIQEGDGVTGLNGHHIVYPPPGLNAAFVRSEHLFDRLTSASPGADATSVTHVDWAQVPGWLAAALGDTWTARFENVTAADGCARAFFHLADTTSADSAIRVSVSVHTVAAADSAVDVARSADAARNRAIDILDSTDRDPEALWARGALDEFGDWSVQYRADIGAGRVLVGAGNTVVDISGMASTAALDAHARRLLQHVVRRDAPPLKLPTLRSGRLASSGTVRGLAEVQEGEALSVRVQGVSMNFAVYFEVGAAVAAAGATSETTALLFDKAVVERGRSEGEGEARQMVHFTFVAREVGTHRAWIHVADAETMVTKTHLLEVEVA